MKKSLADKIEQYLKALIDHSEEKKIEIQRVELAETFACVPSQVTYVIATRFGCEQGYVTESRRGGSGFVRIARNTELNDNCLEMDNNLFAYLEEQKKAERLSEREVNLVKSIYVFTLQNLPYYSRQYKEKLLRMAIDEYLELGKI